MPQGRPQLVRALAPVVLALCVGIVIGATVRPPISRTPIAHLAGAPPVTNATRPTTTAAAPAPTIAPAPTVAPTTAAPATTAPPLPPPPPPPQAVVPSGKGMWIWEPQYVEGGDPAAIVARAQATGLTHLYVRMGSSVDGFTAGEFLDALLPVAHAANLRIIGWDFPYLDDVGADVDRAIQAITYVTPSGDRLDGFSADIETAAEHVALDANSAAMYGEALRARAGPSYLLIATVPRPSPGRQADYPYAQVVSAFNAVAPMVYWIDQPPDELVANAIDYLSQFGKPVLPIGQAYDGSLEGGPPGTPTADEISAFINSADAHGAGAVSFWSWQHASDEMWGAIGAAQEVGVKPSG